MDFSELVGRVEGLQDEFRRKSGRQEGVLFFFVDMMEEAGELAEVIRAKEFYKTTPKEDLESELADIFYDLVGIARVYGVDLEKAVLERIEGLRKRFISQ